MEHYHPSFSLGGIGMTGESGGLHLMARIMAIKISHAGGVGVGVEEDAILKYLYHCIQGREGGGRKLSEGITIGRGEKGREGTAPVVVQVGEQWKVFLHTSVDLEAWGGTGGGTITTLLKDPLGKKQSWVHDPRPGSAAKTTVDAGDNPETPGVPFFFVSREIHYSHGLIWDPNAGKAADMAFYDDGGVKWKRRFQGGRMMGRGDHVPAHESYWPGGILQAEEYGSVNHGRHRDPGIGPAYVEYHPNGQKALEVFARRSDRQGGVVEIVGGGAWGTDGKPRTPGDQEARTLSDTGLALSSTEFRDEFFEARRMDRLIREAAEEHGPKVPRGEVVLPHPSGMRETLRIGKARSRGVAGGRGGR